MAMGGGARRRRRPPRPAGRGRRAPGRADVRAGVDEPRDQDRGLGRPALPRLRRGPRRPAAAGAARRGRPVDPDQRHLPDAGLVREPGPVADRPPLLGRRAGPLRHRRGHVDLGLGHAPRRRSWRATTQLRLPIPIDLTPPDLGRRLARRRPAGRDHVDLAPPDRRPRRRRGPHPPRAPRTRRSTRSTSGPTRDRSAAARRGDGQGPQRAVAADGLPRAGASTPATPTSSPSTPPPAPGRRSQGVQRPRPRPGHRAVLARPSCPTRLAGLPRRTDVGQRGRHLR